MKKQTKQAKQKEEINYLKLKIKLLEKELQKQKDITYGLLKNKQVNLSKIKA